jgi:hypothetical protein
MILYDFFDFSNIENNIDKLNSDFFLGKIQNNKKTGTIERRGDLLFGIKNNEQYDMKIIFYLSNQLIIQTITIKNNDTCFLQIPFIMIKLSTTKIHYKIEKNDNTKLTNTDTFNIEFIYGYVMPDLRKTLRSSNYYFIIDDNIFIYVDGLLINNIYTLCFMYQNLINNIFYEYFYNSKYTQKELFIEFEKLNDNFIKLI